MRILYLPTDRPCRASIRHAIAECAELQEVTGEQHLFLLVEHGDRAETAGHAAAIDEAMAGAEVPAIHLTDAAWETVLTELVDAAGLSAADASRARALLHPSGTAYGAGPNKAFLIAAALGVDILHRRDSDVEPDILDGRTRYPGPLEALAIGRPLRGVPLLAGRNAGHGSYLDQPVRFVGSSYLGDAPQDRRDILRAGLAHAVRLQALTRPDGFSTDEVEEQVRDYFVESLRRRETEDFFLLDTEELVSELGVSCVQGVFRDLPEMPLPETLGTDYRQRNALSQVGCPMLFQSRKVRHRYGADRVLDRPVGEAVRYSMRDLRLVVLWIPSWRQAELLRAARSDHPGSGVVVDPEIYPGLLDEAVEQTRDRMATAPQRFAEIYRAAAADVDGVLHARLAAVAATAAREGPRLVAQVEQGIRDYTWLSRRWPALIGAAPAVAATLRRLTRGSTIVPTFAAPD